ncbi:cadherin-related tumor suppressor-like [Lutzomyia longipalpis]|uniref:cadherin-related tumor suppressor-like n=1 Tax=Lutzomyia longipalpis TaxID=7200 RepID=UPI002483D8D8|nr:cadherin-related tumor suppressor-like [Lutzomyia longipalpis]
MGLKDKSVRSVVNRIAKWFLLIYLCIINVQSISAQRCTIPDVQNDNVISLPMIAIGQPSTLATYNMEDTVNIINITNNADSGRIFINADYNSQVGALTLFTTEDFPNYAQFEEKVTIIVTISFTCVSLTRDITFIQPLEVSNDHDPEFLQPIYEFKIPLPLPANFDLTVFQEIAARDIDIGENGVTFTAESDFITVGTSDESREPKTYYATMITKTQILSIVHSIAFEITATDIGGRSSTVAVYIESDGENTFIMRPIFERALYTGVMNEDLILTMSSSVILDTETYDEEEVEFSLQGDDSRFFTFTNIQNVINIQLQEQIVEEELEDKNFLQFMVVATRPGVEEGATAVLIDLLKTCPEVTIPTTEEPTPCPEVTCPTFPTDGPTEPTPSPPTQPPPELCPDPEGPVFQEDFYTYRVSYGQLGNIGAVRASHPDESALDVIEYSLNFKDDSLGEKISIDGASGQIGILEQLIPEVYGFEVFASILVDGERKVGRALVTVIVEANELCSPTPVETSLMVRRLKENAEHEIMSTQIENCEFEILGFQPNDQEYFYIENKLLKSIEFDREAEIFADMLIPQFQISLKLDCPETPEIRRKRSISWLASQAVPRDLDGPKEYVYTNDIPHASTVTILNVIVDDENDNKPEIIYPTPETGLTFGYPEPSLADKLLLSNVLQVRAIDRDEGENAIIKYALHETSAHFTIDSETGIIYPKKNALASSTLANLRVIATDRAEDEGTLQGANVNIAIHRLSFENIAVVTVEDVPLADADAIRRSIYNVSDARIIILHSTNIPAAKESSLLRQSSDTVDMKFLVYGFASERLLNTPQIEQRLNDVAEKFDARTTPLEEVISVIGEEGAVTGYIVGLSVLSAVLLAVFIAAFWGWWKWIRPYEYKTMENESVASDDNGLNPDFDKRAVLEGHIPEPIRLSETYNDPERLSPSVQPTLENGSVETGELRDEPKPESPPKERRKSIVTFNEDVERIEIVTEVPADTQSDSEKEVYKF